LFQNSIILNYSNTSIFMVRILIISSCNSRGGLVNSN
jgi:hypothetical protein